jgi:RES domain-containing protein
VPDGLDSDAVDESALTEAWRERTADTRVRGDEWLGTARTALLRVPSAIVPEAANYLLNPAHVDATRISISSTARAAFDPRLMSFVKT